MRTPDFGDWWARSLQAYAAEGIVPDWVSIQNEPDFFTSQWETCVFGPTEGATVEGIPAAGYGQALDAVSGAIQAANLTSPPVLLGPETTGFKGNIVQQYLDGLDTSELGGIAHHLYGNTGDNPGARHVQRVDARHREIGRDGRPADLHDRILAQRPHDVRHRVAHQQRAHRRERVGLHLLGAGLEQFDAADRPGDDRESHQRPRPTPSTTSTTRSSTSPGGRIPGGSASTRRRRSRPYERRPS